MSFVSIMKIKQHRKTRLMELSTDIEVEREKVMRALNMENLSDNENMEKTKGLENLMIEYTYLYDETGPVTRSKKHGKIKESKDGSYPISCFQTGD